MASVEAADVAIVGAGAAGSLLAAKLAGAGKKVIVLEAGPAWRTDDFISSQIWARRLKWGGEPVAATGKAPVNLGFNSGHGFGGAAAHHYAVWLRLHPEDFRVKSMHGRSFDWPISYDDLRPYYDAVQGEVGISGDAAAEIWRPAGDPYPMPPLVTTYKSEIMAHGFAAKGLRTAPAPRAINSVEYKGRPACIYDGWCDAGCPTGALANPLVTYLKEAQAAGAEIRPWAHVTRLTANDKGSRIESITYRDQNGEEHEVRPSVAILAAFAIQTPRLLLSSKSDRHPQGLANSSGTVGQYLMSLPVGEVSAMFDEETEPYMGVSAGDLVSQDQYDGKAKPDHFGSHTWLIGRSLKPNDLLGIANARVGVFGAGLHDFMKTAAHKLAVITMVGEDQPVAENRLTLSAEKDRFGVPKAQTSHSFTEDSTKLFQSVMAQGVEILRAAGAKDAWTGPIGTQAVYGTTRMGGDPATSVTNGYGQTHDLPNLFIAGGSLFPTTGAIAATFTIKALAFRTSDFIIKNWSSLAH